MYTFTCPLTSCNNQVMTAPTENLEEAAHELTAIAETHLKHVHPDVHKTHEEVDTDIRAHMAEKK